MHRPYHGGAGATARFSHSGPASPSSADSNNDAGTTTSTPSIFKSLFGSLFASSSSSSSSSFSTSASSRHQLDGSGSAILPMERARSSPSLAPRHASSSSPASSSTSPSSATASPSSSSFSSSAVPLMARSASSTTSPVSSLPALSTEWEGRYIPFSAWETAGGRGHAARASASSFPGAADDAPGIDQDGHGEEEEEEQHKHNRREMTMEKVVKRASLSLSLSPPSAMLHHMGARSSASTSGSPSPSPSRWRLSQADSRDDDNSDGSAQVAGRAEEEGREEEEVEEEREIDEDDEGATESDETTTTQTSSLRNVGSSQTSPSSGTRSRRTSMSRSWEDDKATIRNLRDSTGGFTARHHEQQVTIARTADSMPASTLSPSSMLSARGMRSARQREADLAASWSSDDDEEEQQRLYTVDENGQAPWMSQHPPSPSQQRSLSYESLDLQQLSDRWLHFLNTLHRSDPTSQEYIKREVRAGIPREIRGLYWKTVTGAKGCLEKNPDLYSTLVQMPSAYEDKILKDVYRTMPHLLFFRKKDGAGQRALFNVLKAYSVLDKELGYCQSMSFIVAILLLYMPEQDAFWVLCQLTKVYHIRGFFQKGLPLLRLSLYQLERLTEQELPQLYHHFKDEGVNTVLYASEWFSTLFAYNFPLEIVVRVWDVFLAEGNEYLFKIALAVLKLFQDDLLRLPFEHVIEYLKQKQNRLTVSPGFLIKLADAYSRVVDKATLDALELRYNSPKKSIFRLETV